MVKIVNVSKIVDAMEKKEDCCFTSSERLLLELAVLEGAKATLDIERETIKELKVLKAKHFKKLNWFQRLCMGVKK